MDCASLHKGLTHASSKEFISTVLLKFQTCSTQGLAGVYSHVLSYTHTTFYIQATHVPGRGWVERSIFELFLCGTSTETFCSKVLCLTFIPCQQPNGYNQYKGLQHDIMVQASLGLIKEPPFLLGKVHSHVLKGHRALNRTHQRSHSSRVCRRRRGPSTAAPVPARRQILAEGSPRRASDPSQDSCTSAYPARYTSRRHRVPKIPTREPISPNVY